MNNNISLIAAMGKNRVIGDHGRIPWHLTADFKRFKELTTGHPVVMGRKTYESIGKALPGRTNIVLSRNSEFAPADAAVVSSLKEALDLTKGAGEVFVIGGGMLYNEALPIAQKMYLTEVDAEPDGDTFFPEFSRDEWREISREHHAKDEKNLFDYTFVTYQHK